MIYLLLCILVSVTILILFRSFSHIGVDRNNTIIISYLVSFILAFLTRNKALDLTELPHYGWFYTGLVIGVTFYVGFQLFALSAKKIGLAITSVSANMSVVVPVIIAMVFYNETVSIGKIGGLLLVLVSFYLIFKKEKHIKLDKHFIYFPILLFVFNGLNASLLGFSDKIGASDYKLLFMSLIFLSAFVFGGLSNFFNKSRKKLDMRSLLASLLLGILNYASTMLILKSLSLVPDSIFFPIYNSGYIALSAVFGFLLFKEKLRTVNTVGIAVAVLAIIIITSGL